MAKRAACVPLMVPDRVVTLPVDSCVAGIRTCQPTLVGCPHRDDVPATLAVHGDRRQVRDALCQWATMPGAALSRRITLLDNATWSVAHLHRLLQDAYGCGALGCGARECEQLWLAALAQPMFADRHARALAALPPPSGEVLLALLAHPACDDVAVAAAALATDDYRRSCLGDALFNGFRRPVSDDQARLDDIADAFTLAGTAARAAYVLAALPHQPRWTAALLRRRVATILAAVPAGQQDAVVTLVESLAAGWAHSTEDLLRTARAAVGGP